LESDEKLKIFGEIFAAEHSRDMLFLLTEQELYCSEIVDKLNMRTSLVIHHLKKMRELGLVIVTQHMLHHKKNSMPHKFYRIDMDMLIEFFDAEVRRGLVQYNSQTHHPP